MSLNVTLHCLDKLLFREDAHSCHESIAHRSLLIYPQSR